MKLKLFGTTQHEPITLVVLNGGYDAESGRMMLMVKNETQSGTVTFDINEARKVAEVFANSTPPVERVDSKL